ncbi:VTT domain-containing protein [uncultured Desulfuromusa sp.]|uniref:VTT domain-containing protein n=1 Tax=uncultured Desulfuromusa sp. TaxID=219183 RepID=UPI002AA93C6E|nr:VTT domain-containing protein [uncultured Desulfuromusa sp.]
MANRNKQKTFHDPGKNCWQVVQAEQAAFLIDGESYYRAVAEAFEEAQHAIYILGWDVDSRVRLRRDSDEEETFGQLIDRLARSKPELEVYVLEWDFAVFYSLEREFWSFFSFGWMTHKRVHFELDDSHPAGASQHQKIVVVDDRLAFVGGMDLASYRWDTSEHLPGHPQRCDNGHAYGPVHDAQMLVTGEIARTLGNLARWRWQRATGETLPEIRLAESAGDWPFTCKPDFVDQELAILRTLPAYAEDPEVREVEQFYLQAINQAGKYLYLENQYFSSQKIALALEESLLQSEGPEIVLVLPQRCPGWLEEETMGVLRKQLHHRLQDADQHHRLMVCYPERVGLEDDVIIVHSKLLITDDQIMTIGSANLSNRSMSFDSECNLSLAADGDPERANIISRLRDRLLAEHLDCNEQQVAEKLRETGSLLAVIEQLGNAERSLKELPLEGEQPEWQALPGELIADPEKPIGLEQLLDYFGIAVEEKSTDEQMLNRRKGWAFFLVLLGALLLGALWRWSPLSLWLNVENLMAAADYVRESSLMVPIVLVIYLLGSCLMFPINLLILATALSFSALTGFFLALCGSVLGGLASYLLGRCLGRNAVQKLAGKKVNQLSRKLARRGWLAVALIRVIPIAPFTVVNMVAGASHISARSFILGTLIGMCPGILAIMIFEEGLERALTDPQWQTLSLAILALAIGVLVVAPCQENF